MLVNDPEVSVAVGNVTFEPGCRNNWHVHTDGYQILLVTGGEGWYQEEGEAARKTTSRRCCSNSQRDQTLAWCNERQLVRTSCHHIRSIQVYGTCDR